MNDPVPDQLMEALTDRERTILHLIASGLSNAEIADSLSLSSNTVKWYIQHVYDKLGVKRRTQAVNAARAYGLLQPAEVRSLYRPTPVTPFIGREAELAELDRLLDDPANRLVTILGPGGIGKTQLALALVTRRETTANMPTRFVGLETLTDQDQIISAIADAIDYKFIGLLDSHNQLLTALRGQNLTLVLDNFEHLLDHASLIADILSASAGVAIVITSRVRLNLRTETVFTVKGLPYPPATDQLEQYGAVQLFLAVARRTQWHFEPGPVDWPHIARICQLVEGMPLAVEIAARWVDVLAPAQIEADIEHGLNILRTRMRDVTQRHRSMLAVFEHSWRLLAEDEREVFKKLAVFRGGFDLAAAEVVAGASVFGLSTLVDKSMVVRLADNRFTLHELLRQFAWEKLFTDSGQGETDLGPHADNVSLAEQGPDRSSTQDEAIRRHAAYFLQLAERAEPELTGPGQATWFSQLEADHDNLRLALSSSLELGDAETALRIAGALRYFWGVRGYHNEARRILQRVLDQLDATDPRRLPPLAWLSEAFINVDYRKAELIARDALTVADEAHNERRMARALYLIGLAAREQGDYELAAEHHLRSLTFCRALDDRPNIGNNLRCLGIISHDKLEFAQAETYYQQSLDIFRTLGRQDRISSILILLGTLSADKHLPDEAVEYYEQGKRIAEAIGYRAGASLALNNMGTLLTAQGNFDQGRKYLLDSVKISRRIGDRWGEANSTINLGFLLLLTGKREEARKSLCDGLVLANMIGALNLTLEAIVGFAWMLADNGEWEEALRVSHLIEAHRANNVDIQKRLKPLFARARRDAPPAIADKVKQNSATSQLEDILARFLRDCSQTFGI